MRNGILTGVIVSVLGFTAVLSARGTETSGEDVAGRVFSPALAGAWMSEPYAMALNSPFDVSVWGPGAKSVRTVRLDVQRSGDALLTVTKRVIDKGGRPVLGSTSVEEATLRIAGSRVTIATRREHDVDVVKAVRTYPDDQDRWDLNGLKVKVVTFEDDRGGTLEVRVDTPEGSGSFWEMLRRSAPTHPRTDLRPVTS